MKKMKKKGSIFVEIFLGSFPPLLKKRKKKMRKKGGIFVEIFLDTFRLLLKRAGG